MSLMFSTVKEFLKSVNSVDEVIAKSSTPRFLIDGYPR